MADIFLQWKGTDACFDLRCDCGEGSHFDGSFAYYIKCPACGVVWENPSVLQLKRNSEPDNEERAVNPTLWSALDGRV